MTNLPLPEPHETGDDIPVAALTRRRFFGGASAAGLLAATSPLALAASTSTSSVAADGTPEQIHLTWGEDPASMVTVSWVTRVQATRPRVLVGQPGRERTVHARQRTYTDGLNGQTVFTYHALLDGLAPGETVRYAVTGDNDAALRPFEASFRTAERGRKPFRFTSYGDLATPVTSWVLSSMQSRYAVAAVERFQPLFHLLNGDLCYANLNPLSQPAVWADYGNNVQASAANRPWMPCPGNHEIEFHNGAQGFDAYLARHALPDNGTRFPGRWYAFRVGAVLFVSLSADDVAYQDGGPFVAGPAALQPAASTGNGPVAAGTSFYVRGYSGGAQTRWLEETLSRGALDEGVEWIIVQMHQDALTSSANGNGADKGLREAWLPLFDRYGVDLVLCGHDHDYERSWPVRGCNHGAGRDAATGEAVETLQPRPVAVAPRPDGSFDTTHGTIHLILGGGGTSAPLDVYGVDPGDGLPQAKVFTKPNRPIPGAVAGAFVRNAADAVEDAVWSARRDTGTGYGIAVFDVEPDAPDGRTSITINYYHAPGADQVPNPAYELFETVVLGKKRRAAR